MAVPASTENYTVPGGIKLFFNEGNGERDLGNMTSVDIDPTSEDLEHFSNRSGQRRKDKVIPIEEKCAIKFSLDEPVAENLRYFFRGDDITTVGESTGTKTDQKVTLDGILLQSVGQYYGLTSVTLRQFLDYCFLYDDSVDGYVDNSTEADTVAGTPFELIAEADDILYLGKLTQFKQIYADLGTNGSYTGLAWEYYNGSIWSTLTTSGAGDGLDSDGAITFTPPVDWAQTIVNEVTAYFIRATATAITTAATANNFRQNMTQNTDWILDPGQGGASGRIDGKVGRLAGGGLVDGEEVKVSFTYATWASLQFNLAMNTYIEGSARLEVHPATGRGIQKDIVIPKCILKPQGGVSLDDKKWEEIPFTLEILDDYANNPTAPFGYVIVYETS